MKKAHKQITVPLSPTLEYVLREYIELLDLEHDDLLFPKLDKKKMRYDTLHQTINNFCKHRYVPMKGINTFRNTFATLFIKNGNNNIRNIPPKTITKFIILNALPFFI